MGSTAAKKIETTANVAIILLALVVGAVLIKRQFHGSSSSLNATALTASPALRAGARLSLRDVDWTKSRRTLLLALSKGCHFCTESAPFYRKLADETSGRSDLRLIAVFPLGGPSDAKEYLNELGVSVAETKQAPLEAIGARGTPTLVLVDSGGTVMDSWTGRLTAEKETELLGRFKCDTCD